MKIRDSIKNIDTEKIKTNLKNAGDETGKFIKDVANQTANAAKKN